MPKNNELKKLIAQRHGEFAAQRPRIKHETLEEYSYRLARTLLFFLKDSGNFLYDGVEYYYQDTLLNRNYLIGKPSMSDGDFYAYLTEHYNFSFYDVNASRIYARLYIILKQEAQKAKLHQFACYVPKKHTVYIRNNEREIIKLTSNKATIIANGKDGVLMKSSSYMTDLNFTNELLADIEYKPEYLDELFFDKLFLEDTATYPAETQRVLLRKYIFSFMFKEILSNKPVLIAQGDTGSGKTALMRSIGRLLWGGKFNVIGLPENERDFINAMVNKQFVGLDNVDEDKLPKYFVDALTSLSTGGGVSYRPLYANPTSPSIEVMPESWIGISSRTPFFNRPDVANRAVIIKLQKPLEAKYDLFGFESKIVEDFHNHWYYILGEIMHILANLKADTVNRSLNYRMVEFGNFAVRSSEDKEHMINLIEGSVQAQREFATQNNPLVDALKDIAEQNPEHTEYDIAELSKQLFNHYDINFKSTHGLGRAIKGIEEVLKEYIHLSKRITNGKTVYILGAKAKTNGQIGLRIA